MPALAETGAPAGTATEARPCGPSLRSRAGLNAANFFLAEITAVVMPFLGAYFQGERWTKADIGVAVSLAGLGVFLMQTPAGIITDRVRSRRTLLAAASLLLGVCYGLLPFVPPHPVWVDSLLFVAGVGQSFFLPLLGALALGLAGHAALNAVVGENQCWNHVGNLAAALLAMGLVTVSGTASVFVAVPVVSLLAAGSVFVIREGEIDEARATGTKTGDGVGLGTLLRDRRVVVLLATVTLFHLANAPVMPFVGAYVKDLGGDDVQVAAVVLVAQAVMIPVSLAAGAMCDTRGRKWVFGVGLVALPVRILLYAAATAPWHLVALQALDGIGAGVYGVVIVATCADLTRGRGGFNALSGLLATALAVGGVVGPLGGGYLADRMGVRAFFLAFAGVAALAAAIFLAFMPETRPGAGVGDHG